MLSSPPFGALLTLALLAACDAFALPRAATPMIPMTPSAKATPAGMPAVFRPLSARSQATVMDAGAEQPAIDVDATEAGSDESAAASKKTGLRAWFSKWMKFDRDQLSRLGVDAFFTYGVVSNINAGITVAIADRKSIV